MSEVCKPICRDNNKIHAENSNAHEIILGGKCSIKPMLNEGLALHYTRRNEKQEEALLYTYAYVWKHCRISYE